MFHWPVPPFFLLASVTFVNVCVRRRHGGRGTRLIGDDFELLVVRVMTRFVFSHGAFPSVRVLLYYSTTLFFHR
jgi:hypothetical protein